MRTIDTMSYGIQTEVNPQQLGPEMLLEIVGGVQRFEDQVRGELIDDIVEETGQLNELESGDLKLKYELPFEPRKTIGGLGNLALVTVMVGPDALQHELLRRTLETVADDNNEVIIKL